MLLRIDDDDRSIRLQCRRLRRDLTRHHVPPEGSDEAAVKVGHGHLGVVQEEVVLNVAD